MMALFLPESGLIDAGIFVKKSGDTMSGQLNIEIPDNGSTVDTTFFATDSTGTYLTGFEIGQYDLTSTIFGDFGKYTEFRGTSNGLLGNVLGVKNTILMTSDATGITGGAGIVFIDTATLTSDGIWYDVANTRMTIGTGALGSGGSLYVPATLTVTDLVVNNSFTINSITIGSVAGEQVVLSHNDTLDALSVNQNLVFSDGNQNFIYSVDNTNSICLNRNTQADGASWGITQSGAIPGTWTAFSFLTGNTLSASETFMCWTNNTVQVFKMDGAGNLEIGNAGAGIDHTLTVKGETNDIIFTFDEDLKNINSDATIAVNFGATFSSNATIGAASSTNTFITSQRGGSGYNAGFAIGEVGKIDFWDIYSPSGGASYKITCISDGTTFNGIDAFEITNAAAPEVRAGFNLVVGFNCLSGVDPRLQFGETTAGKLANKGYIDWVGTSDYFKFWDDIFMLGGENIVLDTTTGTQIGTGTTQKLGFYGATPIVQPTEITDELTTITFTAPGTPDYAVQDLTAIGGYGFVTKDEGNTVLSVIANLQARVNELETALKNLGLLADAD